MQAERVIILNYFPIRFVMMAWNWIQNEVFWWQSKIKRESCLSHQLILQLTLNVSITYLAAWTVICKRFASYALKIEYLSQNRIHSDWTEPQWFQFLMRLVISLCDFSAISIKLHEEKGRSPQKRKTVWHDTKYVIVKLEK